MSRIVTGYYIMSCKHDNIHLAARREKRKKQVFGRFVVLEFLPQRESLSIF
jgi:hypothetical protein